MCGDRSADSQPRRYAAGKRARRPEHADGPVRPHVTFCRDCFRTRPLVRRNLASVHDAERRDARASASTGCLAHACWSGATRWRRWTALTKGYFLYWEDADLCRRLRGAGWETRYLAGRVVVHDVGQIEPERARAGESRISSQCVQIFRDTRGSAVVASGTRARMADSDAPLALQVDHRLISDLLDQ